MCPSIRIRARDRISVTWLAAAACGLVLAPAATAVPPAPPFPRRCVIISLDGMRPDAIEAAGATTLGSLIAAGAYTDKCQNELPPATLPNHASMVTGQAVQQHGVFLDAQLPGHIRGPTLFDMATKAGRRVGFFASKKKFSFLCKPKAAAVRVIETNIDKLTDQVVDMISSAPPDLLFIHYNQPDGAGHSRGWMSPEYLEQVRRVDQLIGRVRAALIARGLDAGTVLIVSADHGGQGTNHMLDTPLERNVPLIVSGGGIARGQRLAGAYFVRDIAPMAAFILGLPLPAGWKERAAADVLTPPSPVAIASTAVRPPVMSLRLGAVSTGLMTTGSILIWLSARRREPRDHAPA